MIQSDALNARHIRHGFFTREGGHSSGIYASLNCGMGSGDDKDKVADNRARMAAALGVAPDRFITAYQIHSPQVVTAEQAWTPDARPRADAIVTRVPGLAIGVSTADCGPVLFADPEARVIGAAHAGWKGALAGVTGRTLDAMEKLGAKRQRVVAVVGPAIGPEAYEVGPEFPARYLDDDPANGRFFRPSATEYHALFDLGGYLAARLAREGAGTVINLSFCTFSDEQRFFSYRRATHRQDPSYGRQISAIALT